MDKPDACKICNREAQPTRESGTFRAHRTICARCGEFDWDIGASPLSEYPEWRVKLSGYVREQNAAGITPMFTHELVNAVERFAIPPIRDRSMRLLAGIVAEIGYDTSSVHLFNDEPKLLALSYSDDFRALLLLFHVLHGEEFLNHRDHGVVCLTAKGCIAAEEQAQQRSPSAQGFVAMSFAAAMNDAYTFGFDPAIRNAGYAPLRIDNKEHTGPISDAILTEIRRSRFVIADYTEANNGVYFEAGFAIGLGIAVIPTCRADYLEKLHFDIRHINTLKWDTPADLALSLTKRISAVLGDGPLVKPQEG